MGGLSRLDEHLYVYEDTCLVYLIVDGQHGLLVDCGSGAILDELESLGVRQVEWVLHTHHHRDQCQGDPRLVDHGASLAVPEREEHLFVEVERFWSARQHMHKYDLGSEWFTLRQSVPVGATLGDYGTFEWRSYTFRILPAPGHTKGSIVLLTEVDGRSIAFTGDLIAAPGRLWQVDALQWTYGAGVGILDGVQPAVQTLSDLCAEAPDRLLPSHGQVMESPTEAIHDLAANLRSLVRAQEADANDGTLVAKAVGLVPDRHLVQISDHLWMNQYSFANSFVLISDSGNALFLDYGYPTYHHFLGGFRFTEHSIRELSDRAGLKRVELVIPSHYHDDHIAGVPYLQRTHGTRVWAHEVMVDILQHPGAYNLPCLLPEPIHVERSLRDGEMFDWHEFQLRIVHTPGHTYYHAALYVEVDGLRAAFTGDTLHAGAAGPILGGPIYQNRFRLGDFELSVERLREWNPDLLLTGHTGVAEVDEAWLDIAWRRAREAGERLRMLVPPADEVGFGLDPSWVSIYPYEQRACPGQDVDLTVRVRNHGRHAIAAVSLEVPAGWSYAPQRAPAELPVGKEGEVRFTLHVPDVWTGEEPAVICADVALDDGTCPRRCGEVAQALIHREHAHELDGEHTEAAAEFLLRTEASSRTSLTS